MKTGVNKGLSNKSNEWGGRPGDMRDWLDENLNRIPDEILVAQGKREDNRGRVYNTKDRSTRIIHHLDEQLRDDETKDPPLENEAFQFFDSEKKKWVIDEKKKELAEKEMALSELKAQIDDAERRTLRPLRAKEMGRATPEDLAVLNKHDSLIEKELRPQVEKLEEELKGFKKTA